MEERERDSTDQAYEDSMRGEHGARSEAESTRERLIATARRVFARDGYRGASFRTITQEADANPGAITYHFGTKESLYQEVLRQVLTPLRERILEVCASEAPTEERIKGVLLAAFAHLMENPDQARFMVEIRLGYGPIPPIGPQLMEEIGGAVAAVIQEGQADGLIRPGPPILYVMSLMAQPVFLMLTTKRTPVGMLPVDPHSEQGQAALLDHMVRVALHGLAPEETDT